MFIQYLKKYTERWKELCLSIGMIGLSILLFTSFYCRILSVGVHQFETISKLDFNNGYILNYSSQLSNESLYIDLEIPFYSDRNMNKRIQCSSIMQTQNIGSDNILASLDNFSVLRADEIIISKDIALSNGLGSGSIIYGQLPYESQLHEYKVASVTDYLYNTIESDLNNSKSIIVLGYDKTYADSIRSKYVLLSGESAVDKLSSFPQIINYTFSKNALLSDAQDQMIPYLIWICFCLVICCGLEYKTIYRRSDMILKLFKRKGMARAQRIYVLLLEPIVLFIIPTIIAFLGAYFLFVDQSFPSNWLTAIIIAEALVISVLLTSYRFYKGV